MVQELSSTVTRIINSIYRSHWDEALSHLGRLTELLEIWGNQIRWLIPLVDSLQDDHFSYSAIEEDFSIAIDTLYEILQHNKHEHINRTTEYFYDSAKDFQDSIKQLQEYQKKSVNITGHPILDETLTIAQTLLEDDSQLIEELEVRLEALENFHLMTQKNQHDFSQRYTGQKEIIELLELSLSGLEEAINGFQHYLDEEHQPDLSRSTALLQSSSRGIASALITVKRVDSEHLEFSENLTLEYLYRAAVSQDIDIMELRFNSLYEQTQNKEKTYRRLIEQTFIPTNMRNQYLEKMGRYIDVAMETVQALEDSLENPQEFTVQLTLYRNAIMGYDRWEHELKEDLEKLENFDNAPHFHNLFLAVQGAYEETKIDSDLKIQVEYHYTLLEDYRLYLEQQKQEDPNSAGKVDRVLSHLETVQRALGIFEDYLVTHDRSLLIEGYSLLLTPVKYLQDLGRTLTDIREPESIYESVLSEFSGYTLPTSLQELLIIIMEAQSGTAPIDDALEACDDFAEFIVDTKAATQEQLELSEEKDTEPLKLAKRSLTILENLEQLAFDFQDALTEHNIEFLEHTVLKFRNQGFQLRRIQQELSTAMKT